jgi:light-regulated signal transduction histidine kinase (bacteriophytochrome)
VKHDQLPVAMADRSQLVQVFQNLIGNAIKFRGSGAPMIHITAEMKVKEWVFSVADNGIGIAAEHAENVFVIFRRLHTRAEYSGNGIGLSICKKIIEHHGGRIWFESDPGHGSTFKFTLPVKVIPTEGDTQSHESA